MLLPLDRLQRAQSHYELVRNESCIEISDGENPYDMMPAPNAKRRRAIQQHWLQYNLWRYNLAPQHYVAFADAYMQCVLRCS